MATPKMHVIRNIKSDAVLFGHGKSTARFVDDTTGTHNYWQLYVQALGTSGINRGLRVDMTVGDGSTTNTSTYETIRAYLKVNVPVPKGGSAVSAYVDHAVGTLGDQQEYVGTFSFAQTSGTGVGGGRMATLKLYNAFADTGFTGVAAACSFIDFEDGSTSYYTPALFTMPGWVADASGCPFVTNTASPTHGIKIYIGNVLYYICLVATHS